MSKKIFLEWYEENLSAAKEPFFSKKWDSMIAMPTMQNAIASSKKAQTIYADMETKIALDHAMLIFRSCGF